jgi:ethanolamine kinase
VHALAADPARVLPLRVDDPDDAGQLTAVVCALVPEWRGRRAAVHVVGGGITNVLRRLETRGLDPVLVRIYGPETERVIDREGENRLFAQLAEAGRAPPYLGRFENGRVEGFLPGLITLEPKDLVTRRRLIAPELARMHALPCSGPSLLWSTLTSWMEQARALGTLELGRYADALEGIKAHPPQGQGPGGSAATRVVLAHNDLLAGNVLWDGADTVRFIDFEYGAPAPAAFDVANHFCEYAGFDSDFEAGFPDRRIREDFARHYLSVQGLDSPEHAVQFTDVVDAYVLTDHLWWGTWAVLQARYSPIDFDFLQYARLRFAGFDLHAEGLP